MSAVLVVAGFAATASAQSYHCVIDSAGSSATYTFSASAPFLPAPNPIPSPQPANISYMIGGAALDPMTSPATRTRPGTGFGSFTGNSPVPITAGNITATAPASATTFRPTGSAAIYFIGNRVGVSAFNVSLLGGVASAVNTSGSVTFVTFRTNTPTSLFPLPGASVPLSLPNTSITGVAVTQVESLATGPAEPTGPGQFSFSVPLTIRVLVSALVGGAPLPTNPIDLPVTLSGTVTTGPGSITVSASLQTSGVEVQPGPQALAATVIDEPLFGGKLAVFPVLGDLTLNFGASATVVAPSTQMFLLADYNRDGTVDQEDLGPFITAWLAEPSDASADYNLDGIVDQEDLIGYITAYFEAQ